MNVRAEPPDAPSRRPEPAAPETAPAPEASQATRTAEDLSRTADSEATLQSQRRLRELPPDAGPEALVGLVLPGQFRVLRMLGGGGFGTVYLAEQVGVERLAVIKVVRPELVASANLLARFEREAKVLASLGQDHLVQLYVADRLPNGQPFLAMEYGGDRTLQDEIRREGRFPPLRALVIAEQICDALEEAHNHDPKVVHRDLKPANVMLAEKGGRDWVKVVDVGMARLLGPGDALEDALITARGALIGTPAYFSPEQARGDPADERSDLYALGCVLFEMLAGRLPFDARTPPEFIHAHCYDAPLPLEQVGVQVPHEVRRLIYRALEKEPADRFQSAGEMRAALLAARAILAPAPAQVVTPLPEPAVAPPSPAVAAASRALHRARQSAHAPPPPRSRAWWVAGITGGLVLLLAALWLARGGGPPSPAAQQLASAREAEARKDFKAALAFARRAGPAGSALALRLSVEAEAQDVHERLLAALAARDAEQVLELARRCPAPGAHFCSLIDGRLDEVRALYASVHLAAAGELRAKGDHAACLREAALVQAVDPSAATARSLAEVCAAAARERPADRAAAGSIDRRSAPGPRAAPEARVAPEPVPAADLRNADAAASRLLEQAIAAGNAGDTATAAERLLAAEEQHPAPELQGRIYKNLIAVSMRAGEQARACRYLARLLPLVSAPENEKLGRMAAVCASSGAAEGASAPQ